jgi:putative polyketide hydroxylase
MSHSSQQLPVLIAGAGPAGLALSLCLARQGIASRVFDRRETRSVHPRAHWINTRSMELFQLWGFEPLLKEKGFPSERMPLGMLGQMVGIPVEERKSYSPSDTHSVAQDIVELGLELALENYTEYTNVEWNTDLVGFIDKGDHVETTISCNGKEEVIQSRFFVGCDGAHSKVRNILGIEMIGDPNMGSIVNAYFYGKIDSQGVGGRSKDPSIPALFVAMDGDTRFTCQIFYDPEVETAESYTAERCADLIRKAAQAGDDVEIDVKSVRPWTLTALVADSFQKGNVFLVGDAAHAFPPSGGFGLNSGVGDAHNLAWKLVQVVNGNAAPSLLDSYTIERRPIACMNTMQSFRNSATAKFLGMGQEAVVDDRTLKSLEEGATKTVRSMAHTFEPPLRMTWEMIEHADAVGQSLGYAYDTSPIIVQDGVERPDIWIGKYIPNACPGARAPHLWATLSDGTQASLIHLFDGKVTLLTLADGVKWRDALAASGFNDVVSVVAGQDWQLDLEDLKSKYGLGDKGAVLVRPDGHVAFRAENDANANELVKALSATLGRNLELAA